jgi:Protein of unknown function (DUF3551)
LIGLAAAALAPPTQQFLRVSARAAALWLNMPCLFRPLPPFRVRTLAIFCSLALLPQLATSAPARAHEMPYDPYPWCAEYYGPLGGGTNCGFLTIEQCRAAVSGIGGSCEPNQFYNPRRSQGHRRKAR